MGAGVTMATFQLCSGERMAMKTELGIILALSLPSYMVLRTNASVCSHKTREH